MELLEFDQNFHQPQEAFTIDQLRNGEDVDLIGVNGMAVSGNG
jgi:hypothetical protein